MPVSPAAPERVVSRPAQGGALVDDAHGLKHCVEFAASSRRASAGPSGLAMWCRILLKSKGHGDHQEQTTQMSLGKTGMLGIC